MLYVGEVLEDARLHSSAAQEEEEKEISGGPQLLYPTISININCTTTTINMGFMNLLSDMNGTTNNNNYNNMSIPCPDFKNTSSINGTFMSKCAMAKENTHSINEACRNDAGFINYLEFNYCTMDGLTPVSMIILVCSPIIPPTSSSILFLVVYMCAGHMVTCSVLSFSLYNRTILLSFTVQALKETQIVQQSSW